MSNPRKVVAWTEEADAALKAAWATGGFAAARAAFPGLGKRHVHLRAGELGLHRRAWRPEDDAQLRRLWNAEMSLDEIAAALCRPQMMTYQRAVAIGLPPGCPDGWELLTHASLRTGFETDTMRRILAASGGTIRPALSRPRPAYRVVAGSRKGHRHFIVVPAEVDAAVEHWLSGEPVAAAARRVGITPVRLRRLLRVAGVRQHRLTVGRPAKGSRPQWRVTPDEVARALAAGGLAAEREHANEVANLLREAA